MAPMIWSILEIVSVVVMAILGAILAFGTPKNQTGKVKAIWVTVMGLLALVAVIAKFNQDADFEEKLTGGDHYAFIQMRGLKTEDGKFEAQVGNETGIIPFLKFGIYRFDSDGTDSLYWGWTPFNPSLKTTINLRLYLPLGKYRADFFGSNGVWRQIFDLREEDGFLIETSEIVDDERNIIRPKKVRRIKVLGSNEARKIPIPRRSPQERQVGPASRGTSD